jgi:hypothetical protein
VTLAVNGEAHSPQNFASGEFGLPHEAQASASGVAHSLQNFRPGSLSVWQFGQITRSGTREELCER